jgi:HD domain
MRMSETLAIANPRSLYALCVHGLIDIPDTDSAAKALRLVTSVELAPIVNHSLRTFFHAGLVGAHEGIRAVVDYDPEMLFYACVFHDVGTANIYDGPQRFEVEGADAAARFLRDEGVEAPLVERVWEAVALHTSPGIAERLGPLTRLVRLGVIADFNGSPVATPAQLTAMEAAYPRLEIERVLADVVISQALGQPSKAPSASWPGWLLHAHVAGLDTGEVNPAF